MNGVDFINIQYIFYKIYEFSVNFGDVEFRTDIMRQWPLWAMFSLLISLVIGYFVLYYNKKIKEVAKMEDKIFGAVIAKTEGTEGEVRNERWERVLVHLDTDSQSEWRTAILEADIILDEMTRKMGYHGETLGERLKSVERSDFLTINQAWEAHKIRNAIAHEGSNYILTKREAKRVIDMYRQVFEEFEFI
ncbi:TPA: hypothetical protein DCZ46_00535 [Candidatus Campbellbacteria bacterium]|nr:MAG: protein of unknown function with transmembrane region [Candidatus Campbellbacteria bacterium GW2011_OD1_34_28]KKP75426.1 MAG: hypothetical protein UR74_C0001G0282 [Candidatus Campbellbacteria bacterium GW2011_GWD2_35_24]KKP76013.1 MAG: hypothetical protein UR75_C0001G0047 [Candidatus Campbellbacteria bacterium GW2011_GWC2_35_28]KKP77202.1 MAG: hypothetical protein UR76_C0001G0047 [Candidatus Campbellbacteria bacterium GW2011_GWC1_35_31]KKP79131.1 MAG: hypothetical protein UR79_C0001G004